MNYSFSRQEYNQAMFSRTSAIFNRITHTTKTVTNNIATYSGVKHFAWFILPIFLIAGCSSFINLIDNQPDPLPLKDLRPQASACNSNNALATHSIDDSQTLNALYKKAELSLEEELIMTVLQQMAVRPATTSPWARLQVGITDNKGVWSFYDYYRSGEEKSLWQGLADLTKRLKLKSMPHYLNLAQRYLPRSMEIGSPFASYLEKFHQELSSNQSSSPFFKAGQVLKSGESLPAPDWRELPKKLKTNNPIHPIKVPAFHSESLTDSKVTCNFDIDLYSKSVYLVRPDPGVNYNAVARIKGKRAFIIITSVELQNPSPVQGEATLLKQKPSKRPVPICLVNHKDGHQLLLTSLKGRDPGQHLYHLLQYNMSDASKINDIQAYLAFPRHQFLYGPARMLYESSRGSNTNLETFLRMDFPIYHSPSLGEVWVWGKFSDQTQGLAVDERENALVTCQ